MTTIIGRPQPSTPYQFNRADLTPGAILALSNAEHIRCQVRSVDSDSVDLTLLDDHLIDGRTEMTFPINELAERGWRLTKETNQPKGTRIDPSDIRPGAILASPVEGIRCHVDSVENGRAILSVLDNNNINGDKQVTVAIGSDLLTGWHLLRRAA